MRAFAAAALVSVAFAAGASARPLAPSAAAPASCATPTARIGGFARHHAVVPLPAPRASFGLRLRRPLRTLAGTVFDHSGCVDTIVCTIGQPCEPPVQPPPRTTPVRAARLAGIKPRVAVADAATPNVLYVGAEGMRCLRRAGHAVARCLRAASR